MSEWLIARDMNMTRANVIVNLIHPENWGQKKNPAATPSALADWGFVIGHSPSPLGLALIDGTLSWQEACILSLAKRGPADGNVLVKPFVAMMKALALLQEMPGKAVKLTARGFTRLTAINGYADITQDFCSQLNDPDKPSEGLLSNYQDIWLNALVETGLFVRCGEDYELLPSIVIKEFVSQVAQYGGGISACPSKRDATVDYYSYMGAIDCGLPEIFSSLDHDVVWHIFPHFIKKGSTPKLQRGNLEIHQLIAYGAPGTGKSHRTKLETEGHTVYRTTFHPDSDYSTFVGTYKPTMSNDAGCTEVYKKTEKGDILDSTQRMVKGIAYDFVPQAFIKAYVDAWQRMNDAKASGGTPDSVFLVIEEINRGNCAQIFGDLFQLLDRKDDGYSEYPIDADADLKRFLSNAQQLGGCTGIPQEIADGTKLQLPPNLFIRATMNTSDQSLFPIDSAFKRRWDWRYAPIKDEGKEWYVKVGEKKYKWWSFLEKINDIVFAETNSADKQMGYFFVKLPEGQKEINLEKFVNKVAFYLWNDVFKDCEIREDALKKKGEDGKVGEPLKFTDFFMPHSSELNEKVVANLFAGLGVEEVADDGGTDEPAATIPMT